jgi:hypothetical protein
MAVNLGGVTPKSTSSSGNSPSLGGATPKDSSTSPRATELSNIGGVTNTNKN